MSEKIGIIGIGLVGTAIAEHLLSHGYQVVGSDIDDSRCAHLAALGGDPVSSPSEVARKARRIFLSLFDTDVVCQVIEGENGILSAPVYPRVIIDTTTGDPDQTIALADRLKKKGIEYLDATISGSSEQVRNREAVFMVGATEEGFSLSRDLLEAVSDKIFHVGDVGNGSKAKLASNLILGLNRLALAEGLVFAEKLGLELKSFLELLKATPAYSVAMDVKGQKMIEGDFSPQSRIRQHYKDVETILRYAAAFGLKLPLSKAHLALLRKAIEGGMGDLDNSAIILEIRGSSPAQ